MNSSLFQQYKIGQYIIKQKLNEVKKFPIVLMLEPKFKCNLSCKGCGKIDFFKNTMNIYFYNVSFEKEYSFIINKI